MGTKPGPATPARTEPPAGSYEVVMPPERHVPITALEIVDCFRSVIEPSERVLFNDICKLIEACSTTEFMGIRLRVKKNFRLFSAAALNKKLPSRRGRPLKKESTMDEQEVVFLRDFFDLMDIAHYKCITQVDWVAAKKERFLMDMPIRINWNFMDDRLLSRFFERYPDRCKNLYQHSHRCLVFHRGVGVVTLEDLFITGKVDLLVDYLIAYPAKRVWEFIRPYVTKKPPHKSKTDAAPRGLDLPTTDVISDHRNARIIQRQALRLMLPNAKSVFHKMFTKVTLREPTYKDIVTLYRKKITPPTMKEMKKNPACMSEFRFKQRNIVVKRFYELPIADLEIVLPDKEVELKLVDKLTLYGTAVGALVAGFMAFYGASVELSYILSTLGVMGGKLFQTYTTMQAKKAELMKQMSLKVSDISLEAQEGVLFSILDEMSDQYVKEMLLAYLILYRSRESSTEEELDDLCEAFLEDKFDVKIDFAMEESLPRLLRDGLILQSADDQSLSAVPLETANQELMKKWARAFAYNDSNEGSLSHTISNPIEGLSNIGGGLMSIGSGLTGGVKALGRGMGAGAGAVTGAFGMKSSNHAHSSPIRKKVHSFLHPNSSPRDGVLTAPLSSPHDDPSESMMSDIWIPPKDKKKWFSRLRRKD